MISTPEERRHMGMIFDHNLRQAGLVYDDDLDLATIAAARAIPKGYWRIVGGAYRAHPPAPPLDTDFERAREAAGVSRQEVAEAMGIVPDLIRQVETGQQTASSAWKVRFMAAVDLAADAKIASEASA